MIKKLDHVGIAVESLNAAIEQFAALTGKASRIELVAGQKVKTAMFRAGQSCLELLQGTGRDSPISRFVRKRGEGVHHLCFEVENLQESRKQVSGQGFRFVELPSDDGAGGSKVAFIHPKSSAGVLIELVEYPKNKSAGSA
jgi:methylmalonyl-CoA epimerase